MQAKAILKDSFYFISLKWLQLLLLVFPVGLVWYGCIHYAGLNLEGNQALLINLLLGVVFASLIEALVIIFTHRSTIGANASPLSVFLVSLRYWLPVMQLTLIKLVLIGIGLMMFIVPGIFLAVRFALAEQHMVLRSAGVLDALRTSYSITAPNFLVIFVVLGNLFLLHQLYEYSSTFAPEALHPLLFPLGMLIASFSTIAAYRIYSLITESSS